MAEQGYRPGEPVAAGPLGSVLRALVHGNVVIAAAGGGVAVTSVAVLGLPGDPVPVAFVVVATFLAYGLNRHWDRLEDATNLPGRRAFLHRHGRGLLAVGAIGYLAALGVAGLRRPWLVPLGLVPPVAVWLYSVWGLKRRLLLKNLVVGVVWGAIPVGMALYHGVARWPAVVVLALLVAALLTLAAAVFDIKDVAGDRAEGIRTIPLVYGIRRTKIAAAVALGFVAVGTIIATVHLEWRFAILLAYLPYVGGYLHGANPDRGPLFYGLVIDGEHVAVGILATLLLGAGWL